MSFEQPDNPFFLSFTDVLTCVLGGSVALFLIFVVMVKLVPAQDAGAEALIGRSGLAAALERQKLGGKSPVTIQFVSSECPAVRAIKTEATGVETWDFTDKDANDRPLCGKMLLMSDGIPDGTTTIEAPVMPQRPLRITVAIGSHTWSPLVGIDPAIWSEWQSAIVRLNPLLPQSFIRFANNTFRGRPFDGSDQL